eukprot:9938906-Heterocapsa_arctica.AAC.1
MGEVGRRHPAGVALRENSELFGEKDFNIGIGTDCKSLKDLCDKPIRSSVEKRIALDLTDVRQAIDKEDGNTTLKWWRPGTC